MKIFFEWDSNPGSFNFSHFPQIIQNFFLIFTQNENIHSFVCVAKTLKFVIRVRFFDWILVWCNISWFYVAIFSVFSIRLCPRFVWCLSVLPCYYFPWSRPILLVYGSTDSLWPKDLSDGRIFFWGEGLKSFFPCTSVAYFFESRIFLSRVFFWVAYFFSRVPGKKPFVTQNPTNPYTLKSLRDKSLTPLPLERCVLHGPPLRKIWFANCWLVDRKSIQNRKQLDTNAQGGTGVSDLLLVSFVPMLLKVEN